MEAKAEQAGGSLLKELQQFLGEVVDRARANPTITVQVIAIAALFIIIFKPVTPSMVQRFEAPESNYSHGYLVPAVMLLMLFFRRQEIAAAEKAPCRPAKATGIVVALLGAVTAAVLWTFGRPLVPDILRVNIILIPPPLIIIGVGALLYTLGWGAALMAAGILMHLFGMATGINFISAFAIPPVIFGLAFHFFGPAFVRQAYYPLAYIVFMLPLPRHVMLKVTFHMKSVAAHVGAFAVRRMGIDASLRGTSEIWLPNRSAPVEVGYPCSGMRSLIALLAISFFFVYIIEAPRWKKTTLVLSSVPVSWLANITRIAMLTLLSYWYGLEAIEPGKIGHDGTGFALWIVALLGFAGVWGLLNWSKSEGDKKSDDKEA